MAEHNYSAIAAALGRRGGQKSKRPPDALRRILIEICEEIGSYTNRAVFDYWQACKEPISPALKPQHSCWWRHEVWADPQTDPDPGAYYDQFGASRGDGSSGYRALPETWDDKEPDTEFVYHYHDGVKNQKATAQRIREAMCRIRKSLTA